MPFFKNRHSNPDSSHATLLPTPKGGAPPPVAFPERLLVRIDGKGEGFTLLVEGNVRAFAFTTLGTGLY